MVGLSPVLNCLRPPSLRRARCAGGFSLIELIGVIVIVGVLAAIAVARYIALGTDARIAALNTLAATLRSATETYRVLCKLNAACDYSVSFQPALTVGGNSVDFCYGWLCGGTGATGFPSQITSAGFTSTLTTVTTTVFSLDGSPSPQSCSVSYDNVFSRGPAAPILIVTTTSGC